jgi:hypothetical protein
VGHSKKAGDAKHPFAQRHSFLRHAENYGSHGIGSTTVARDRDAPLIRRDAPNELRAGAIARLIG